ncbi:MAG: ATP-binding protein [Syntrophomonas sp.]|nr:ATP-binding protein [Syntrophomonas sp.]
MNSIRSKLWAGMMSLVVMVLVLLWLFQVVFLENFYTQMKVHDIKAKSAAITDLLEQDPNEFGDRLETLAYDNNLTIELLDLNGRTLYQTAALMNGQMMQMRSLRNQVYESALIGTESTVGFSHPRLGNDYLIIGMPVGSGEQISGALILNVPLAPVADTVSILKRQLVYISFILLGAALLISFLLARTFARPVVEINLTAERMATGDFSARTAITQEDEIGQLARTINHLGEQLAQIDTLRKDLIANVSHELRTPLSLIQGYAETLRDVTGDSPPKRDKQLGIIIEESQRLGLMVNDILNLSQLQSGQMPLHRDNFKVGVLIDRVAQRYELLSQQVGVAVRVEVADNLAANADQTRIEQVLYNLISNAFNHVEPHGCITLSALPVHNKVRLEVTNSGPGIDAQDLPHIWERYYKSPQPRASTTGTGLGLAIVKAVLESHGAPFGADSPEEGPTTFWFELDAGDRA